MVNNDLISREALIEDGNNTRVWVTGWNENPSLAHQVLKEQGATFKKLVLEAPAVDAVPVVRCKDCKQFMEFRDSEKEKQGCDGTCYRLIMHCFDNDFAMVNATDYCSWGVKRGG